MSETSADVAYMQRALTLAKRGLGFVSPNPLVGCVIVQAGEIVGEGFHRQYGGPHAEIEALRDAGEKARGAEMYVTLEPCCHTGKTPPCSDAVLRAGLRRVVVAVGDPNPRVSGGGLEQLRMAGVDVTLGVCEAEARQLNEVFFHHIETHLPFVTLKCAITLDGKIATRTGASRWVTGALAREQVHDMRHATDAILVGLGTALADNPMLTTRLPEGGGRNPLRVIVDSELQLPLDSHLARVTPECQTLVATTERAAASTQRQLEAQGVEILRLPSYDDGRVDIEALLRQLGERGLASLLVEGGGTLSATLLHRRLVDKLVMFVAPKIIGGDGLSVIGAFGVETMDQAVLLQGITSRHVGDDLMLEAYLAPSDPSGERATDQVPIGGNPSGEEG